MRAEEIREMAEADIRGRIAELEEERFRLKFRSATETLEEPLRFRTIRRDVARLKTVLRERELAAARGDGAAAAPAGRGRATRGATTKAGTKADKSSTTGAKRGARRRTAKE